MNPSPEIELLLCAAGKPATPDVLRQLCAAVDEGRLLQAADFHGLSMLLAQMLGALAPATLRQEGARNIIGSLFFASELKTLLGAFEAGGVPVIALKGPALAAGLYADPALRPCSDLDFLVAPDRIEDALRVLAAQGYRRAPHFEGLPAAALRWIDCEIRLRGPHIDVDLQWAVAPPGHILAFDPNLLWRERRIADDVPVLSREATLLFLCAHGAKHGWSRLIWLSDVARLVPLEIDWPRACALARDVRCEAALRLGVGLAKDMLGATVPARIDDSAGNDPQLAKLMRGTRRRLLTLPPQEPDSLALTSYNAALATTARGKLRQYTTLIRAPTEAELQALRLPVPLFCLYYPLRMLRMAAKVVERLMALLSKI